jgi:hypothetical protein
VRARSCLEGLKHVRLDAIHEHLKYRVRIARLENVASLKNSLHFAILSKREIWQQIEQSVSYCDNLDEKHDL